MHMHSLPGDYHAPYLIEQSQAFQVSLRTGVLGIQVKPDADGDLHCAGCASSSSASTQLLPTVTSWVRPLVPAINEKVAALTAACLMRMLQLDRLSMAWGP